MNLEEKLKSFKKDDKRLEEIKINKKANFLTVISSLFFASIIVGIVIAFINLVGCVAIINTTLEPAIILAMFGGSPIVILTSALTLAYFDKYSEYNHLEVKKFWVDFISKNNEEKRLKESVKERKEFYQFYELMQDPSFRDAYLSSLHPDHELVKKFKESGIV